LVHKRASKSDTDRVVGQNDRILVRLNSAFIKYFKESGIVDKTGQIVVVVSFDATSNNEKSASSINKRESFVVFGSERQTLGSMLDLDDWPFLGPVTVTGNDLLMRIVIIESDKKDNAEMQRTLRLASEMALAVQPAAGMVLKVAQPIADMLISTNNDDVVFDHRFALHRQDSQNTKQNTTSNELLYGTYVLLQQEDFMVDSTIAKMTPQAGYAPALSELRFDKDSHRLYRLTIFDNATDKPKTDYICEKCDNDNKRIITMHDIKHYDIACNQTSDSSTLISNSTCKEMCCAAIGMNATHPGPYYMYRSANSAILSSFYQSLRSSGEWDKNVKVFDAKTGKPVSWYKSCPRHSGDYLMRYNFQYPIVIVPKLGAVLSQYALHTHLIFSVEKWNGDAAGDITNAFTDFTTYNAALMKSSDSIVSESARSALVAAASQFSNATLVMTNAKRLNGKVGVKLLYDRLCMADNTINPEYQLFADAMLREASSLSKTAISNCAILKDWVEKNP